MIWPFFLFGFVVEAAHADPVEVFVGGEPDLDACSEAARVKQLKPTPGNGLNVRAGPGLSHRVVDLLTSGTRAIICDYSFGPGWVGIVYGSESLEFCGLGSPIVESAPYAGECKSGWVSGNFLVSEE